jgi:hypothetical protein
MNDPNFRGIDNNTLSPSRSLTTSLGREVEKFDQLCDAIESRLVCALSLFGTALNLMDFLT